jgi:apolipoprotein N-acyltransferase
LVTSISLWSNGRIGMVLCAGLVALACLVDIPKRPATAEKPGSIRVAGIQMEFPAPSEVPVALNKLLARHPEAELFVLSEYTFDGPIPERIKSWCRQHKKYLVAGGKNFISDQDYYNTAFVVDADGEIVFSQVKSVPIQFFKDGLPATEQNVWLSPWGKLGICICYDLSYQRITDELVRLGAQAIIAPTMDVADWGEYQHMLHGRIAPVRAAESGVPIFRVCSSGVSQLVDRTGRVTASAPVPGQGEIVVGRIELSDRGRMPLDHWLAPLSVLVSAVTIYWLASKRILERFSRL